MDIPVNQKEAPYTDRELFDELAAEVRSHVRGLIEVLEALEEMWREADSEHKP